MRATRRLSNRWGSAVLGGIAATALGVTVAAGSSPVFASDESAALGGPCGSASATQSEDVSTQAIHNGYCIENLSPHILRLSEPFPDETTNLPQAIFPGETAYFELKYWWLSSGDNTELVYSVWDGAQRLEDQRTVTFKAKQARWSSDLSKITDESSCDAVPTGTSWNECLTMQISADGEQTRFRYGAVSSVPVGGSPVAIAVDDTTHRAYVANEGSNVVSVVDTLENTIVDTITLKGWLSGEVFPTSLVVDRVGQTLYAAGEGPYMVVVELATGKQKSRVSLMMYSRLVVDETRHEVYVTDSLLTTVEVFDTDLAPIKKIHLNAGFGIARLDIALDPVLRKAYVTDQNRALVHVIDMDSKEEVAAISVPGNGSTNAIAVDTTTHEVYVTSEDEYRQNPDDNRLAVIDGLTNTVKSATVLSDRPAKVAVDEISHRAYVMNQASVSVIDATATRTSQVVLSSSGLASIAVDSTNGHVLVASTAGKTVVVFDAVR